ncbi:hypothetical protein FRC07_010813, partial [Ceratobasidium sp. 392]
MDTNSGTHNGIFQHWKSARTILARAVNDYLTASAKLCDTLSSQPCSSLRDSFEKILSGIDLELLSLQSEEEKLRQARTALANKRNKSQALTP